MNVIISAATGYSANDISVYLDTIERYIPNTKVFLIICEGNNLKKYISKKYKNVEPVILRQHGRILHRYHKYGNLAHKVAYMLLKAAKNKFNEPSIMNAIRCHLHISLYRYFIAYDIVLKNKANINKLMLADSRDVIIQADPFQFVNNEIITGAEPEIIGECEYNSGWLGKLYGNQYLLDVSAQNILCSGVTLGPVEVMEKYLYSMCREMLRKISTIRFSLGFDQGIHNYLFREKTFPVTTSINNGGVIATLHHENPNNVFLNNNSGFFEVYGRPTPIIHQYDRHIQNVRIDDIINMK